MNTIPKWFIAIAIVALIWNLMGLAAFASQMMMTPEAIAALPAAERELYQAIPMWVNIAFAVAVFGGTVGSLGLVIKKQWAEQVLLASLIGVLVQMGHTFLLTNALAVYGPSSMIMPAMVILIAVGLLMLAKRANKEAWLE